MAAEVILVDYNDVPIGIMDKQQAHVEGKLHRAVSVFIFNSKNELLLQQRNEQKYHSGGLWSNTACTHPSPTENIKTAAIRCLQQEMGLNCDLNLTYTFIYKANLNNNLIEHEYDYVFVGNTDELPTLNLEEVNNYKFESKINIENNFKQSPELYTPWLQVAFNNYFLKNWPS